MSLTNRSINQRTWIIVCRPIINSWRFPRTGAAVVSIYESVTAVSPLSLNDVCARRQSLHRSVRREYPMSVIRPPTGRLLTDVLTRSSARWLTPNSVFPVSGPSASTLRYWIRQLLLACLPSAHVHTGRLRCFAKAGGLAACALIWRTKVALASEQCCCCCCCYSVSSCAKRTQPFCRNNHISLTSGRVVSDASFWPVPSLQAASVCPTVKRRDRGLVVGLRLVWFGKKQESRLLRLRDVKFFFFFKSNVCVSEPLAREKLIRREFSAVVSLYFFFLRYWSGLFTSRVIDECPVRYFLKNENCAWLDLFAFYWIRSSANSMLFWRACACPLGKHDGTSNTQRPLKAVKRGQQL